ncbi:S-layer homology domain-containing protein [Paenibacillus sp. M1]|uniref:S-layer homology domain-containing protein n=1 Tax=Paenibacillus haidiansis TaxID=1574488 RepID=A0ABU7VY26_9BACL
MKRKSILMGTVIVLIFNLIYPLNSYANESKNNREVNIYITLGTLPTLYAGLNTFLNESESYMWYSRKDTFNKEYLPNWVEMVSFEEGYGDVMLENFNNLINRIYALDDSTIFNLYTDDLRVHLIIQLFANNNIPIENYQVHLLSDGTATYSYFSNLFGKEGSYTNWLNQAKEYSSEFDRAYNGQKYKNTTSSTMPMYQGMYSAAQQENVDYWLQYPEYLKTNDLSVAKEKNKMHLIKKSPLDIYNSLSSDTKADFAKAVGIEVDKFKQFFNKSAKPELIISGTSLDGEKGNFEQVINSINNDFSETYDIYFKPHPVWDPNTKKELKELKRKEFLDDLNIQVLPAQLPMESLLWIFPDVKIGGYSSSLYMSANDKQPLFLITNQINELPAPLPDLYYDNYFGDITFYYLNGVKHFKDINEHWGGDYIEEAAVNGYIKGYSDASFTPNNSITREEFIVLVDRMFDLPKVSLKDISINDEEDISVWAKEAIFESVDAKVITLFEDRNFKPKQYLTRSEMVTIIGRILELPNNEELKLNTYKDVENIPSWAVNYAIESAEAGIIVGREHDMFNPYANSTRAEAIVALSRALNFQKVS